MAYETETENVKDYYANLLILQYRNKPKASATIKLGAGIYLADGLIFELNDILNLETQQGAQLDLIGQILGVNRQIAGFNIDKYYFSFEKATVTPPGYVWNEAVQSLDVNNGPWLSAIYDGSKYVALSEFGYISTSEDGETWTTPASINIASSRAITFDGTYYWILNFYGEVYQSSDLSSWSKLATLENNNYYWWTICYGNGKYVAMANGGYVAYSSDGTNWSSPANLSPDWNSLKYGNGKFVALSSYGDISTSTDGETWTTPANILGNEGWNALGYDGSIFVAITGGMNSVGKFATSTDGVTWTTPAYDGNLVNLDVWDIAYNDGTFIALANGGKISTSEAVVTGGAYGYSDKTELSQGLWKQYRNSTASIYSLQDYEYRSLLKFKAAYNIKTGGWGALDNLYYRFFGDELNMVNNKDLTITYEVSEDVSVALQAAIYLGYIKPPMGIGYSIVNS